jgi:hypothetical protein
MDHDDRKFAEFIINNINNSETLYRFHIPTWAVLKIQKLINQKNMLMGIVDDMLEDDQKDSARKDVYDQFIESVINILHSEKE